MNVITSEYIKILQLKEQTEEVDALTLTLLDGTLNRRDIANNLRCTTVANLSLLEVGEYDPEMEADLRAVRKRVEFVLSTGFSGSLIELSQLLKQE